MVGKDANEDIAPQFQLDRESLSLIGWNTIPGVGSDSKNTVQSSNSVQATP